MILRLLAAAWRWATAPRFSADEYRLRDAYEEVDRDRATRLRGDGTAMREDR